MAKKAKGGGKKSPKAAKGGRKKFEAPTNTKTGKSGAAAAGKGEPEKPFIEKSRMTPGSFLKSLLSTCLGYKSNVDSIVGKIREEIGFGKEKNNLHTGVFAWLRKMHGLAAKDPEKAAEWHYTYLHYMESSGVLAKIEAVGRLPLGDEPQTEAEAKAAAVGDGEDDDAGDGEAEEAAADGKAGSGEEPSGDDPKPDANGAGAQVSRPQFGGSRRQPPQSQSAKAEAARLAAGGDGGGKPH